MCDTNFMYEYNTLINCMKHPMTPGEGASYVRHLPSSCDAGYPTDGGVRQCLSLYLRASNGRSDCDPNTSTETSI